MFHCILLLTISPTAGNFLGVFALSEVVGEPLMDNLCCGGFSEGRGYWLQGTTLNCKLWSVDLWQAQFC